MRLTGLVELEEFEISNETTDCCSDLSLNYITYEENSGSCEGG